MASGLVHPAGARLVAGSVRSAWSSPTTACTARCFPSRRCGARFMTPTCTAPLKVSMQSPHLQSFFLAWDLNARTRPFLNDFWDDFQYVVDKQLLIRRYEVGISTRARSAGLSHQTVPRRRTPSGQAMGSHRHMIGPDDVLEEAIRQQRHLLLGRPDRAPPVSFPQGEPAAQQHAVAGLHTSTCASSSSNTPLPLRAHPIQRGQARPGSRRLGQAKRYTLPIRKWLETYSV